ncbi:MAG: hypothetical protein ABI416_15355 [Ginsengibacter sp.]
MKPFISIALACTLWGASGYKQKEVAAVENVKGCFTCATVPEGTIFCDDFESQASPRDRYFEYDDNGGDFIRLPGVGRDGSGGMRAIWQKGEVGAGALKKSIGRTPEEYIGAHAAYPEKDFKEIYWRIDVKRQAGWTGGGADKLTRAIVFAAPGWKEGMMAHIWSSGNFLLLDPASGIDGSGNLKSTKYNDFANLRWLGSKKGTTDLFSDANADKWFCVISHARLNTPGLSDGVFEFWIDDTFQGGAYNLNWQGTWNADPKNYMINAVLFENYWNSGSPKLQERYFDNILISSNPIKCNCN